MLHPDQHSQEISTHSVSYVEAIDNRIVKGWSKQHMAFVEKLIGIGEDDQSTQILFETEYLNMGPSSETTAEIAKIRARISKSSQMCKEAVAS